MRNTEIIFKCAHQAQAGENLHLVANRGVKLKNYHVRIVGMEHAEFPQHVQCGHGCSYIIQFVNLETDAVELEFCPLTAEHFAGVLLDAIELCHLSA
jgi:hypothetical protein